MMACECLNVYECALLERWVSVLCYVSRVSFFLPIYTKSVQSGIQGRYIDGCTVDEYVRGCILAILIIYCNLLRNV